MPIDAYLRTGPGSRSKFTIWMRVLPVSQGYAMIAVHLQGGLGNQMFQYAFAAQLAAWHAVQVVIDPYWFDHPLRGETPRTLDITKFRIAGNVADARASRQWSILRSRLVRYLPSFVLPLPLVMERGNGVDRAALTAPDNCYLRGFWQSEDYFKDIAATLAEQFAPKAAPSSQDQMLLERMANGNAVSLHVRRGDYVSLASAAAYHGTCSPGYYRQAIDHILQHREGCRFFVFSDDPSWAADNLDIPAETHYVAHNSAANAVQDMRLMSHCRDHIIANSSFSWWGAWLAERRCNDGIIIAPRQWFAGRDAPDIVPARWMRM